MRKYLSLLSSVLLLFVSCAVNKDYETAVNKNNIYTYEIFIKDHPKSKYNNDINTRLDKLYDEKAWKNAISSNTLSAYESYLLKHPQGKYVYQARVKVDKIEKEIEEQNAWKEAKRINSISSYESFIQSYPTTKYKFEALTKVDALKDKEAWIISLNNNTIKSYKNYISNFPNGLYVNLANKNKKELEEELIVKPEWNKAREINTYQSYLEFFTKYNNSRYAIQAEIAMNKIDTDDWKKACAQNTKYSYTNYKSNFPKGLYFKDAETKLIDLKVDEIFSGNYGQMPSMDKRHSTSRFLPKESEITVENDTQYTLTLWYSGIESKQLVLLPHKKSTISLKNGEYRVAASVNAKDVQNYAGKETLEGGAYEISYFIETKYY